VTQGEAGVSVVPAEISDALYGFMASHVLFACHTAGVFEVLATTGGRTAVEVAELRGLHAGATERLLVASTALGLTQQLEGGRYAVPAGLRPFLVPDGERYLGGWLGHLASVTSRSFVHLGDAVCTGETQLPRVLGMPEETFFRALYADERRVAAFASSMWSLGFDASLELARRGPLPDQGLLVDVGGGSGSFAIAAALERPALTALVVDRPELKPHFSKMAAKHGVAARVQFLAADLFEGDLPMADAYAYGYVLSDWPEAAGTRLLEHARDRLWPGGAVFVLERLFEEGGHGPRATALMDLCMLLETHGRHRTPAAYRDWLGRVGFRNVRVVRSSGDKHMICGTRP
jgi:O-methyltransferase domain/Dimerisation domain